MNKFLDLLKIRHFISKNKFRLRLISRTFFVIHKYLSKIYFSFNPSFENQICTNLIFINPLPKKVLNFLCIKKNDEIVFKNYLPSITMPLYSINIMKQFPQV